MSRDRAKSVWPAAHGVALAGTLALTAACLPPLTWPWFLLLPLLAYGVVVAVVPPLRQSLPRLRPGRVGGAPAAAAVALSVLTAGVLLAYHKFARPDVGALADQLPVAAFGGALVAGVYFSVVNAVLEELAFRYVLYEAVAAEWGAAAAVGVSAVCFGVCHLHGYPPGPVGAVLAGLYGVALGLLRWWSGGLALAVGCHVSADATIFWILVGAKAMELEP